MKKAYFTYTVEKFSGDIEGHALRIRNYELGLAPKNLIFT
jgi:hypothetical protein